MFKLRATKTEVNVLPVSSRPLGCVDAPHITAISLKALSKDKHGTATIVSAPIYDFEHAWCCDIGLAYDFPEMMLTSGWDMRESARQTESGRNKMPESRPGSIIELTLRNGRALQI